MYPYYLKKLKKNSLIFVAFISAALDPALPLKISIAKN